MSFNLNYHLDLLKTRSDVLRNDEEYNDWLVIVDLVFGLVDIIKNRDSLVESINKNIYYVYEESKETKRTLLQKYCNLVEEKSNLLTDLISRFKTSPQAEFLNEDISIVTTIIKHLQN